MKTFSLLLTIDQATEVQLALQNHILTLKSPAYYSPTLASDFLAAAQSTLHAVDAGKSALLAGLQTNEKAQSGAPS